MTYSNYNRGTKYLLAGKPDKAMSFFKRQLKETPPFKELYLNMANCYHASGDDNAGFKHYTLASDHSVPTADGKYGPYALALNNLGLYHYSQGDDATAIAYYRSALDLDPLYGECIWNNSIATLRSDMHSLEGWKMYDYRFKRGAGSVKIDMSCPFWDGKTSGSVISVITEQGLGDKIMFARYIKYLYKFFKEIRVVCHPSLDCFYSPEYTCIRVPEVLAVPLCSLAQMFGVTSDTSWISGKFAAATLPATERLKIGVVWSGSKTHANDRNRSCPNQYFNCLLSYGDVYNLNPGDRPLKGVKMLAPTTWSETASYVQAMDVIVSVDTSIVHLAGSLGVPTLMMQPLQETDFRWGNTGKGAVNEWYKSVRCIHNPNSWDSTFKIVKEILECIKK